MHRRLSRGRAFTLLAAVALALAAPACSGLGGGQGRRHQDRATGRAHPGQPRAGPRGRPVLDRGGPATLRWVAPHPGAKPVAGPGVRLRQGHDRRCPGRQGPARQGRRPRLRHRRRRQLPGAAGAVPDRQPDPGAARARERPRGPRCWPAPAGSAWWAWRCCQPICASRWACRVRWWRSRTTGAPGSASGRARSPRRRSRPLAPPRSDRPRRAAERPRRDRARPRHDQGNEYDQQAKAVTANVTFWPKPVTVVMNRKAFESLTPSQQDALRQAGSSVVSRQLAFRQRLNEAGSGASSAGGAFGSCAPATRSWPPFAAPSSRSTTSSSATPRPGHCCSRSRR